MTKRALGHAVKLCKKSVEKIADYEEYDSYTQIYSPEVDAELFKEHYLHDGLYELFLELTGQRFYPALTALKFCRIAKVLKDVGPRNLNRVEIEVCMKKTLEFHEQLDLYAFFDCVDLLLDKIFEHEKEPTSRQQRTKKFVDKFRSMKKPLFYF